MLRRRVGENLTSRYFHGLMNLGPWKDAQTSFFSLGYWIGDLFPAVKSVTSDFKRLILTVKRSIFSWLLQCNICGGSIIKLFLKIFIFCYKMCDIKCAIFIPFWVYSSVAFSAFTFLCNHRRRPFPGLFFYPRLTLYIHEANSPLRPSPAPVTALRLPVGDGDRSRYLMGVE